MSKRRNAQPQPETLDLRGPFTGEDLDEMEKVFQRMNERIERAEREGVKYVPHEEVLRRNPVPGYRPKHSPSPNPVRRGVR